MNKKMKEIILSLLCICLLSNTNIAAQVTIGSDISPQNGVLLELKERTPSTPSLDNSTSDRGILFPRVKLTDKSNLFPMFEDDGNGGYKIESTQYVKSDEDKAHTGLIVFNVNLNKDFIGGLYIWNGEEWRKFEDNPVIQPSIESLICEAIQMSPNKYEKGSDFSGVLKVPYTGGNGGLYHGLPKIEIKDTLGSTPVKGLYLELSQGKLGIGGGEIQYNISGTPSEASPETTDFMISFLGKSCPVSVGSGINTLGTRTLQTISKITTVRPGNDPSSADLLDFGEITIPETGSYAFNIRLYGLLVDHSGNVSSNPKVENHAYKSMRRPYYIYLQALPKGKTNVADEIMQDNAEIDLVTAPMAASWSDYFDYSYTISLGGSFQSGDKVRIRMYTGSQQPHWHLKNGGTYKANGTVQEKNPSPDPDSPTRTSLIFWKL